MESTEEQDRKLVLEFIHLLEKSKQLFNGLRWVSIFLDIFVYIFGVDLKNESWKF